MASSPSTNVLTWSLRQVLVVVRLLWFVSVGGLVQSIRSRSFGWLSSFVALAGSLVGVALLRDFLEHYYLVNPGLVVPYAVLGWFGLWVLVSFLQGLKLAKIPVWESYALLIIVTAITYIELNSNVISNLFVTSEDKLMQWQNSLVPGQRLMGSLWDRLLILSALTGWVVAIFSGSIAMMLRTRSHGLQPGSTFEWFVTQRHVRGARSFLSMTSIVAMMGVALGVASLIAINGVMTGYQLDVQEKILETNAHLVIQKYGTDFTEYPDVIESLASQPDVVAMAPFAFSEAMIEGRVRARGFL